MKQIIGVFKSIFMQCDSYAVLDKVWSCNIPYSTGTFRNKHYSIRQKNCNIRLRTADSSTGVRHLQNQKRSPRKSGVFYIIYESRKKV